VRDAAMDDLLKAYASGFARRKNDKKSFKLGLRSRKTAFQESIVIHHKHWKHKRGEYAFLNKIRSAEPLPEELGYDSRLMLERRTNFYYLCIPMPLEVRSENQAPVTKRIIALDPGVRTFMTSNDPSGESIDFAAKDIGHIYRLCERILLRNAYSLSLVLPVLVMNHYALLESSLSRGVPHRSERVCLCWQPQLQRCRLWGRVPVRQQVRVSSS
jgi:transposase